MKRALLVLTFFIVALFIVSCKSEEKEITHQEVFDTILIGYELGDSFFHVTQDIQLPTKTNFDGVTITWVSANENIISNSGVVNRPVTQNIQVLLILEVIINGISDEKNFLLTVIATNPIVEDVYYTVTFNPFGGSAVTSLSIKENGLINKPSNPTKTGYIFEGWFKDSNLSIPWSFTSDTVTSNITLYAKWQIDGKKYNVTFESNGGTDVSTQLVNENSKIIRPDKPLKNDFEFLGWFIDANFTIEWNFTEDVVKGHLTLYAKWKPKIKYYDVLFNTNGGSKIEPLKVEENTLVLEPDIPTRNNYIFNGWYQDAQLTILWNFENDLLTESLTLYASWYPKDIESGLPIYIVSFETNGGLKIDSEFVAYNYPINNLVNPTRSDYAFEGWYQDEKLTNLWDENNKVIDNMTLYAKWRQLPPKLPAPMLSIGHQPRPIAHIGIGPYDFIEGDNGGYTGYGLVFTNLTTNEVFIWRINHIYKAGFATYYKESDLSLVGIVLTPGDYKLEYFAMGNGVTTRDSDYSFQTTTFTIEKPQLLKPNLVIDKSSQKLTWNNVINASGYEVYINNNLQIGNTSPFDLSNLIEPGIYLIKVVAIADSYRSSEATIEYAVANLEAPKLSIPNNIEINGFMLTWDEVENAIGYKIIINDKAMQSITNSFNLINFDIGNQAVTVKVVALGNLVDYSDSDDAIFEALLPELLPRLDSMTLGDQNGDILGFGNGNYRLIAHLGHPVFQQADWNKTFKIIVKKDNIVLGELIANNGQILHNPGSSTDFYGKVLTNEEKYTVEISLVAKSESGHRDSLPLIIDFTFIK